MSERRAPPVVPLLLLLLLAPVLAAAGVVAGRPGDPTPGPEWIEGTITVDLTGLPVVVVSAALRIHEVEINGTSLAAGDLRMLHGADPSVETGLLSAADGRFNATAGLLVPGLGDVQETGRSPARLVSWGVDGADAYHDPVDVTTGATYRLLPSTFGLGADADLRAALQGLLTLGGRVTRTLPLRSDAGQGIRFVVTPPAFAGVHDGTSLRDDGRWTVDATGGTAPVVVSANLTLAGRSPLPPAAEEIQLDVTVDMTRFDLSDLRVDVALASVDVSRAAVLIPPGVDGLTFASADGIRLAVADGLTTWRDIEILFVNPELAGVEDQLAALTGQQVRLEFAWENGTLTGFAPATMDGPPVRAVVTGRVAGGVAPNASDDVVTAILAAGGSAPVDLAASKVLSYPTTVILPPNATLANSTGDRTVRPDGRESIRFSLADGLQGQIRRPGAGYGSNDSRLDIFIDIHDANPDLALLAVTGDVDVRVSVRIVATIRHIEVPASIRSRVPAALHLDYVDADLVRVLLRKGIITHADLDEFVNATRPELARAISKAAGTNITPRLFLQDEDLRANATGAFRIVALGEGTRTKDIHSIRSIGSGGSGGSSGSGGVPHGRIIEVKQLFPLQGKPGWFVRYTIAFPSSMDLVRASGTHHVLVDQRGRAVVVTFGFEGGTNNVTIVVRPTLAATLGKSLPQWPCFGSILLVVILLVWWVRYRKRRPARVAARKSGANAVPDRIVRRAATAGPRAKRMVSRSTEGPASGPVSVRVACPACGHRFPATGTKPFRTRCPSCGAGGRVR